MSASPIRPRRPEVTQLAVQGALALDLAPRLDPPAPRRLPVAPPRPVALDVPGIDLRTRRRLEQWAHRYLQAATEIVAGDRPVSQLLRWSTGDVYADLSRRAQLIWRAQGREAHLGRLRRHTGRPKVRSARISFVRADAAEASAHITYGARSRAVAARFEERDGRWVCTALEFA